MPGTRLLSQKGKPRVIGTGSRSIAFGNWRKSIDRLRWSGRRVATLTDAAAKRVASAILEDLFVLLGRTFALRLWDGTVEGPKASFEPRFTLSRRWRRTHRHRVSETRYLLCTNPL